MSANPASRDQSYIPEFDSLRAAAAFGVMIAHFGLFDDIPICSYVGNRLGFLGVDLFFVLSSYLITAILWRCRSFDQPIIVTLKQFYMRRFLRIFPLYYGVLGLAFILVPTIRENAFWFVAYAVNFGKALDPSAGWRPLNHFWTLAVEEQYYIIWPLVVLLASRRMLLCYCILGLLVSLGSRCVLTFVGANPKAVTQLTFCCLEPLALGAIYAVLQSTTPRTWLERRSKIALIIGAAATFCLHLFGSEATEQMFSRTCNSFFCVGVLATVATHSGHRTMAFLRGRLFMYLGRISYGLYVLHLPVAAILQDFGIDSFGPFPSRLLDFAAFLATTVVVASLSWHLFESPLNQLKRYFPYRQTASARSVLQPGRN